VHVFVSSRPDYCNSLLCGISDELLQKLQVIRNAASRDGDGSNMNFDHIMHPMLRDLYWQPFRQRTRFKLAMTVYKCLNG